MRIAWKEIGIPIGSTCVVALVLSGCGGGSNDAALTYGYGPKANGSAVYQPDVVIIQGGARSIRSASANGLSWTIAGNARGARELRVGKIMFATSRAVGRVAAIERRGEDLAVTLAPVRLTEIVRDAQIRVNTELGPESIVYQSVPELPGQLASGASYAPAVWRSRSAGAGPSFRLVEDLRAPLPDSGQLPYAGKAALKVSVGDWEIEPSWKTERKGPASSDRLGLKVQRRLASDKFGPEDSHSAGLKFGVDASLYGRKFHVMLSLPITNGNIGQAKFVIEGIEGLDIGIWGGVENGLQDNQKVRVEAPIELNYEIPPTPATADVPLVAQVKFKFIIETAFSAKNSTLRATGRYGLSGPIGYDGGSALAPAFQVQEPMMSHMEGISLAGSGIVFAFETRFLLGVGVPAAMGGPYGKLTVALGLSQGSALGSPLATCKGMTLRIDVAGGAGLQISSGASKALEKILGKNVKTELELPELSTPVVNKKAVSPEVPLCMGT